MTGHPFAVLKKDITGLYFMGKVSTEKTKVIIYCLVYFSSKKSLSGELDSCKLGFFWGEGVYNIHYVHISIYECTYIYTHTVPEEWGDQVSAMSDEQCGEPGALAAQSWMSLAVPRANPLLRLIQVRQGQGHSSTAW